ncbi:PLC-like phosphodiesterase, partial [Violaceomyces palustris]
SDDASSTLDILLLPFRDPQFFLSTLPSDLPLSSICLPGTHESLALYGWPISTCQSASSSVLHQLKEGIRFLDVRLSIKGKGTDSRLLAYHGITDQRIPFDQVLEQCFDFLRGHGGETLIMSIKQENNVEGFKEMVMEKYVHPTQDFWFLSPRVPTLGECRGKIVLLSRFGRGDEQPGGIHPPIWPNSSKEIFSYKLPSGQTVETQDWYDISSLSNLDSKQELIERLLVSSGSDPEILSLNFCSASSFPLALPPFAAKGFLTGGPKCLSKRGINSRLFDVICDRLRRIPTSNFLMCVFLLDYFEEPEASKDLVSLMIEANFGI